MPDMFDEPTTVGGTKWTEARLRTSGSFAPLSACIRTFWPHKLARIAWTVLAQERSYEARVTKAAA